MVSVVVAVIVVAMGSVVIVAVTVTVVPATVLSSSELHPCNDSEAMKPKQTATKARASCMIAKDQRCQVLSEWSKRASIGLFFLEPRQRGIC